MNSDQGINPVAPSSERLTLTPEDMELIERLVDDELNESERTRLLERLERVPEGWRACALSFLENQTFASALRGLNFVESAALFERNKYWIRSGNVRLCDYGKRRIWQRQS